MASQPGKHTIAMHVLTNISRSKYDQTMKFVHLIDYNMRNIFLEKSYTKCGRESSPRPFSKNQSWAYHWINSLKVYKICTYCIPSWGLLKYIKTKLRPLTTTLYKALLKSQRKPGASLPASFLHDFWRKMFLLLCSINWPNVIVWFLLLREKLGNMCIVLFDNQVATS